MKFLNLLNQSEANYLFVYQLNIKLLVKEVKVGEHRYIVCLNEEERRKDAHDRSAIVASLQEQLRGGDKKLVSNKGYRRFLKVEDKKKHFAVDEKRVSNDALYDGIFVLRTNTAHDAKSVALLQNALDGGGMLSHFKIDFRNSPNLS